MRCTARTCSAVGGFSSGRSSRGSCTVVRSRAAFTDLDGISLAYLDGWSRAHAVVSILTEHYTHNGLFRADGGVDPSLRTFFTGINSSRLQLQRLSEHLAKVGGRADDLADYTTPSTAPMATTSTVASSPVSLLEACDDIRLVGVKLYPRQRELLELVEGTPTTIALAGRQGGKTYAAACFLTWNLLLRSDLDEVARGQTRWAVSIANSREQAGLLLGYVKTVVERSPLLRSQLVSARDDRLTFKGNRVLVAAPCQDRLIRGVSASALVFDEASHFVSESWGPRTLERIWQAARPLLTIYGEEGRTFGISTPADGDDCYGRLFTQAQAGGLSGAVAFRASTQELNPDVSAVFLEQERLLLGEGAFRREYLAEFTAGGGGAFLEEDAVAAVIGATTSSVPSRARAG